ncbi:macro domain-containing protein [Paenibacillus sediminis]|uniref:O-acetyl-ADP-ribose deacetylase (Regulator of RNase III) n=1 Tax=Paenibacillus sediminis TaxID=664909 RepID=A0ABS4H5F2_9BACL|nr:O-acetyl-ADP-ribose deacetylase (regulator of RNase III) [Paenibacillus sediminis]
MLEFVTGDFFDYKADIRVNTVNCVGVMGAGVALAFKNKYPQMFNDYALACKNKKVAPGKPHVWIESDLLTTSTIINFPTKVHWKNPSEYEYIEKGLIWFRDFLVEHKGATVTLPALGCGHGGLNWDIVKDMISKFLGDLDAKIFVFNPTSSVENHKNKNWVNELIKHHVVTILPNDELYPREIAGRAAHNVYCIGNTALLKEMKLSILVNAKSTEKERDSLLRVINEIPIDSTVLLLSLRNNTDYEFAKTILVKGFRAIFVVPYGILNFEVHKRFQNMWDKDRILITSITQPDQTWRVYENSNALKFRQKLADVTLINSLDLNGISSLLKYLNKPFKSIFYINYWFDEQEIFKILNAKKIGMSIETGKIKLGPLLGELENK